MTKSHQSLTQFAIASAAALGLLGFSDGAMAMAPEALVRSAQAACLEKAATDGWRTDQAKLISARALNADRAEVVFDLTKDGAGTSRLTCPYSASQGVGVFSGQAAMAQESQSVDRNRAWWILLPVGLGLLAWAALRGRDDNTRNTTAPSRSMGHDNLLAQADARDGSLEVHEQPNITSLVLKKVVNGDSIGLTGARRNDWLEVAKGGWVRDADVRYNRNAAPLT
ncbi:hypothetical protein Cyagr_1322 [Cyanobium gracile PCC 6307]|uniref:SH3b domain-containing protein n=2 Tax=Cyanobium gracile TaxID=59930 RepID=K9P6A7_CYAGP|nr:hypothetical protein Cyagr_1322 [Cyanobium gracile PCC 6307]